MKLKNHFFNTSVWLIIFLTACDSFQEDMLPGGEEEMLLQSTISTLPNTPVYIDLKRALNTSSEVRFDIGILPGKGTAKISSDAILKYDPNPDFSSGKDFIGIDLLDTKGNVIDSDNIFITVFQSSDSLPCSNGAMSDYFAGVQDQTLYLNPLGNDQICDADSASLYLTLLTQPAHGTINESDTAFIYAYIPNSGFTGMDTVLYELKVENTDGSVQTSTANMTIEIFERIDGDDSLACVVANDDFYQFEMSDTLGTTDNPFILYPLSNDILCSEEDLDHTIDILSGPDIGVAEVRADRGVNYWVDATTGSDSVFTSILYKVCDEGKCDTATVDLLAVKF